MKNQLDLPRTGRCHFAFYGKKNNMYNGRRDSDKEELHTNAHTYIAVSNFTS